MASEYFSLSHETTEILSQFPVLKEFSQKQEYGLEEIESDNETLLETLQKHHFSKDEISIILRKMYKELDKLYSQ